MDHREERSSLSHGANHETLTDSSSESETDGAMELVHFLPEGRENQDEHYKELKSEICKPSTCKRTKTKKNLKVSDIEPAELILKAARKGRLDLVEYVLDLDGSFVGARDEDGYTPLHRAAYEGHENIVKTLLLRGADVLSQTEDGWQPLHCACRWGQTAVASLLLQNGADINAQTNGKLTSLHLAATGAEGTSTLELLLCNRWLDASLRNSGGDTAYDIARRSGKHCELFELVEESVNFK